MVMEYKCGYATANGVVYLGVLLLDAHAPRLPMPEGAHCAFGIREDQPGYGWIKDGDTLLAVAQEDKDS